MSQSSTAYEKTIKMYEKSEIRVELLLVIGWLVIAAGIAIFYMAFEKSAFISFSLGVTSAAYGVVHVLVCSAVLCFIRATRHRFIFESEDKQHMTTKPVSNAKHNPHDPAEFNSFGASSHTRI